MQAGIMAAIHWYFGVVQPLVVGGVIGLYGMLKSEMFQVHVLGAAADGDRKRPWSVQPKGANPFGDMAKLKEELSGGDEEPRPTATRGKPTTSIQSLKKRMKATTDDVPVDAPSAIEEIYDSDPADEKKDN